MALPKSIGEQEKLAEEIIKARQAPEPPPPEPPPAPKTEPEPPEPPQPPEPAPPKPKIDPEDYKERYTALRNHRDQELVDLQAQLQERDSQLTLMRSDHNAVLQRVTELEQTEGLPEGVLSAEEMDVLGEDMGPAVTKVAQAMAAQQVRGLTQQVQNLTAQLATQQQQDAQAKAKQVNKRMYTQVQEIVPTVAQIDQEGEFKAWMTQPDTQTGIPRNLLAKQAWSAGDSVRVASFYQEWEAARAEPEPPPDPRAGQVVPGSTAERQPVSTGDGIVWTRRSVGKFYDDQRRGKYSDKEAEALEQSIFAAQNRGQIGR